jgi:hypothetical protein
MKLSAMKEKIKKEFADELYIWENHQPQAIVAIVLMAVSIVTSIGLFLFS